MTRAWVVPTAEITPRYVAALIETRFWAMSGARQHAVLAGLLGRSARQAGEPPGWREKLIGARKPPILYNRAGDGPICPLCGQPSYLTGAWLAQRGARNRGQWHSICVALYRAMTAPNNEGPDLARQQGFVCAETGASLIRERESIDTDRYGLKTWKRVQHFAPLEVDHRRPLWRVWRELKAGQHSWPAALAFWGWPNLAAITPEAHRVKTAREASERAGMKKAAAQTGDGLFETK